MAIYYHYKATSGLRQRCHQFQGFVSGYIKKNLKASVLKELSQISESSFHQLWINIQSKKNKSIIICVTYRPPDCTLNCFEDHFKPNYIQVLIFARACRTKRYDRTIKKHVDVDRPAVVGAYNANMGGIDLFDMMCTLYKRQIKSRRWYLYLFYHSLTMVMANAWFLYRRESKSLKKNKPLQMKEFQIQAATSLMCQGKVRRGRPSLQTLPPAKKHRVHPGPQLDVRFDNVGHLPMSQEKKGRCRYCPNGYSF